MKAVRLTAPGQPLELQELPLPRLLPGEILVRVRAAGICHTDAHYRAGHPPVAPLPVTLGHEIAGLVERVGEGVAELRVGERVCLHYLVACVRCPACRDGREPFCSSGEMIGKHRDGGYAEFVAAPARCAFPLPAEIPFQAGAVMMCSSVTALHALRRGRLRPGETVAVWGTGGLGISAVQLARALGAASVFAVDIRQGKLALAARLGAEPINARGADPVEEIRRRTGGRGVDLALELAGLRRTLEQALRSLAPGGRLAVAGLGDEEVPIHPYRDLLCREAEIIGVADHLAQEIPELIGLVREGKLDLGGAISRTIPLDPRPINEALDRLDGFGEELRVVIVS